MKIKIYHVCTWKNSLIPVEKERRLVHAMIAGSHDGDNPHPYGSYVDRTCKIKKLKGNIIYNIKYSWLNTIFATSQFTAHTINLFILEF